MDVLTSTWFPCKLPNRRVAFTNKSCSTCSAQEARQCSIPQGKTFFKLGCFFSSQGVNIREYNSINMFMQFWMSRTLWRIFDALYTIIANQISLLRFTKLWRANKRCFHRSTTLRRTGKSGLIIGSVDKAVVQCTSRYLSFTFFLWINTKQLYQNNKEL